MFGHLTNASLVLRVGLAVIFIAHGVNKLQHDWGGLLALDRILDRLWELLPRRKKPAVAEASLPSV